MFNLYALDSSENKSRYSHWLFGHPLITEEKTQRLPFSLSDFQRRLDSRLHRSPLARLLQNQQPARPIRLNLDRSGKSRLPYPHFLATVFFGTHDTKSAFSLN